MESFRVQLLMSRKHLASRYLAQVPPYLPILRDTLPFLVISAATSFLLTSTRRCPKN